MAETLSYLADIKEEIKNPLDAAKRVIQEILFRSESIRCKRDLLKSVVVGGLCKYLTAVNQHWSADEIDFAGLADLFDWEEPDYDALDRWFAKNFPD